MVSKSASISLLQSAGELSLNELASISQHAKELSPEDLLKLEATLRLDVESEFDARFLAGHLARQSWAMCSALEQALDQWLLDENLHQELFLQVYGAAFPDKVEDLKHDLEARNHGVAFEPIQHLMDSEFEVLCLLSYDELATVKAYRALLPQYRLLGPSMTPLLDLVVRDEGQHYAIFARILRAQYPTRLSEAADQVDKIRSNEGTPYGSTFVLDHDCDDWTDSIFDETVVQLKRAL